MHTLPVTAMLLNGFGAVMVAVNVTGSPKTLGLSVELREMRMLSFMAAGGGGALNTAWQRSNQLSNRRLPVHAAGHGANRNTGCCMA